MILTPTKATLKKYGLSEKEWREMLESQHCVCFVCGKEPPGQRLAIDHEHVKQWKKKPPEQRKKYVRGLLCTYCNFRLLRKGMTLEKARKIVEYLENYQNKLNAALILKNS
jgi:DNA-directed RNA polymerase subunit RPC12/RpoP